MDWIQDFLLEIGVAILFSAVFGIPILIQKARFSATYDKGYYVMKYPSIAPVMFFGFFMLTCYAALFCVRAIAETEGDMLYVGGFIACLLLVIFFGILLMYVIKWRIVVTTDRATVYSLFKKERTVKLSEISTAGELLHEIAVYVNREKIFTVRESTIGYETFRDHLRELGKIP